jgi:hypothetical protein
LKLKCECVDFTSLRSTDWFVIVTELLYDCRFTANQFVLATSPLRLTTSNCVFQLNPCDYSPYVTSSLTRGWVCRLQLLPVLASAVILKTEYRGTHDHILLSQIRDSPNLEGQVPVFISLRNRVARLYPQALGSLFVASHDSKGYGGDIRPRLHMDRIENPFSHEACLPIRCLETAVLLRECSFPREPVWRTVA